MQRNIHHNKRCHTIRGVLIKTTMSSMTTMTLTLNCLKHPSVPCKGNHYISCDIITVSQGQEQKTAKKRKGEGGRGGGGNRGAYTETSNRTEELQF